MTVQAHDGDRSDAVGVDLGQVGGQPVQIRLAEDAAVGSEPLVHRHDLFIQKLRHDDVPVEDARSVLVRDAQCVAEATGDHQSCPLAMPFQQRVGGDGGSHSDGGHLFRRNRRVRCQLEQCAYSGDSCVGVADAVLRKQLVRDETAVGPPRDDVGERTAAVDPELPAGHAVIAVPGSFGQTRSIITCGGNSWSANLPTE